MLIIMTNFSSFLNKKIGIYGLGITGSATYNAIVDNAQSVIVWDDNSHNRDNFARNYYSSKLTALTDPLWSQLDAIIMSPGIPVHHEIFKLANNRNIEVKSDIDILFEENSKSRFIGITGTNGKSTTTALIHHIVRIANLDYHIGGNIGLAALSIAFNRTGYILELSSFQLELSQKFKANIAVLLNIAPDHLDRHLTMDNYVGAKQKIIENLAAGGFGIINVDNKLTKEIYNNYKGNIQYDKQLISISTQEIQPTPGIAIINNKIIDNISNEQIILELATNRSLQGTHNQENIAASYAVCRLLDIEIQMILEAIKSFKGLPHRAEYLGSIDQVGFYNDSKATNADAAAKSLSFLENIYWLVGGIAKEGGISTLTPYFNKIKKAYIFGQDSNLFAESLSNQVDYEIFRNMQDATIAAYNNAKVNDTNQTNILLAPAAASYDQFKNFEHRGELFRELFNDLVRTNGKT